MMEKDTRVVVYGMPEVTEAFCDFKRECTLEESVDVIKERWANMSNEDKKLYQFSVMTADTNKLIYEFYLDEAIIPDEYKNIIEF